MIVSVVIPPRVRVNVAYHQIFNSRTCWFLNNIFLHGFESSSALSGFLPTMYNLWVELLVGAAATYGHGCHHHTRCTMENIYLNSCLFYFYDSSKIQSPLPDQVNLSFVCQRGSCTYESASYVCHGRGQRQNRRIRSTDREVLRTCLEGTDASSSPSGVVTGALLERFRQPEMYWWFYCRIVCRNIFIRQSYI